MSFAASGERRAAGSGGGRRCGEEEGKEGEDGGRGGRVATAMMSSVPPAVLGAAWKANKLGKLIVKASNMSQDLAPVQTARRNKRERKRETSEVEWAQ